MVYGRPLRVRAGMGRPHRRRPSDFFATPTIRTAPLALSAVVALPRTLPAPLSVQVDYPAGDPGSVNWHAVADVVGYNLYWDTDPGLPYANKINVGNTTTYLPTAEWGFGTRYVNIRPYFDADGLVEGDFSGEMIVSVVQTTRRTFTFPMSAVVVAVQSRAVPMSASVVLQSAAPLSLVLQEFRTASAALSVPVRDSRTVQPALSVAVASAVAGPQVPLSVQVDVVTGGTTAALSWTASTDALRSSYRVYYGSSPGAYFQPFGSGVDAGAGTSFTVTGLTAGSTYYFAVTTVATTGDESGYSNEVSKLIGTGGGSTTPGTASAPLSVAISATAAPLQAQLSVQVNVQGSGGTTATLNWTASTDALRTGYRVYYGTAPGTYNQKFGAGVDVATNSFTVTGLTAGTWYFAVTTVASTGDEGGYSNEVSKVI